MESPTFHLDKVVKAPHEEMIDFDGPLDLILYLLSKNKIEIQNIQISLLLEQYLAWLELRKQMDLEIASEFITMASHLVYLKTRMLLTVGDHEADEEMDQLIQSLEERRRQEEYRKVCAACPELQERWEFGRNILTRQPERIDPDKRFKGEIDPSKLVKALERVRLRAEQKIPPPAAAFSGIVGREIYPVSQKIGDVVKQLFRRGVARFRSLFQAVRSRSEAAATFLAVLELYKNDKVNITPQGEDYEITLTADGGKQKNVSGTDEIPVGTGSLESGVRD